MDVLKNSTAFIKWEKNIPLFSTNLCFSDPSHELRNDNDSDHLDTITEYKNPTIQPDVVGHPEQDYELTHTITQQSVLDLIVAHPAILHLDADLILFNAPCSNACYHVENCHFVIALHL
eukprot:1072958-Ditylum_brightwellii.AAC.1